MSREWEDAGIEPRIADMLSDPIVRLVMRRDGIGPEQVRATVEGTRGRLAEQISRAA